MISNKRIVRVKSINLNRFRGFVGDPYKIDTDADIILLTGSNGFGKTSLIDALCLLLNRYYYEERLPLCSFYNNGNTKKSANEASAYIEAVVEYDEGKTESIKIDIKENSKGPEIIPSENFWMRGISNEMAARCSFFYQDLLSKLFEEEEAQTKLLDFLNPVPPVVIAAQNALKEAQTKWKIESDNVLSDFHQKNFPSEVEINKKRKEIIIDFINGWNELLKNIDSQYVLPKIRHNWLFLNLNELRTGWQKELKDFAVECIVAVKSEHVTNDIPDEKPFVPLKVIKEALDRLRNNIVARTLKETEKLKLLLHDLPDEADLYPPELWSEKENEIGNLRKELQEMKSQLTLLEKLEKHFGNPKGPGLVEILKALQEKGKMWLEVPEAEPDLRPPILISEWLKKSVTDDIDILTEELENWQSKIEQMRYDVQKSVFEKSKEIEYKEKLLESSKNITNILKQIDLDVKLKEFIKPNSPVPVSVVKEKLSFLIAQPNHTLLALEQVQNALSQWIDLEEQEELRLSALKREKKYIKIKEYVDVVSDALGKETGKDSVLNMSLVPTKDHLNELEKNVNEILMRFRIVEGICPIQFQFKKNRAGRKSERTLQIISADNRLLSAFSTGQKAQLGLALLLGLNYSLNKYIGHNIIAMDDITDVFDMAQLPRITALIRQIAYAPEEKSERRQIFIVSHHEDLTNRLLDYLIPPEGRELRILNFVDWNRTEGPKIEQRRAIPALKVSSVNKKRFGDMLNEICEKSY